MTIDASHRLWTSSGAAGSGEPGTCCDPTERRKLRPYALTRRMDVETREFEAHLLACAACLSDLKALDRAGAVIREIGTRESPLSDRAG